MTDPVKPPMLTFPITSPWHVQLPRVFRYLDQKWIDLFFETGQLRVSTFRKMAEHDNAARLDAEEGTATVHVMGNPGLIQTKMGKGLDAYMLCGSVLEQDRLMDVFGEDGYFRIDNTVAFAEAVGRALRFREGLEGHCEYVDQRFLVGTADYDAKATVTPDGKIKADEVARLVNEVAGGPQLFFLKPKSYADQAEYRFVWIVGTEVDEPLVITCPEAVQFCSKITGR